MAESLSAATLWHSRWGQDWLVGLDSAAFWSQVEYRCGQLPAYSVVLLAEADPLDFLAGFYAACSKSCTLLLANPHWRQREWHQVAQVGIVPEVIWGSCSPTVFSRVDGSSWALPPAALLIPTGGSSGRLRFAIHTWNTLAAAVRGLQQHLRVDGINAYCVLPLYHVSGLMQAVRTLLSGGQLALQPFKALEQEGPLKIDPAEFVLSLVPTQLQRLLRRSAAAWLQQFQAIFLGGAPAWPALLAQAQGLPLALTYGMTETAAQIATLLPAEFRAGHRSSGRCLPHGQITIVDAEGRPLPPGSVGQIQIQAKSLALGYVPGPGLQASQFLPDDLGYVDAAGYLHVVGRGSTKIISGGENIFPQEVEAALLATGRVVDCAVVGLPDPLWGQAVTVLYVPQGAVTMAQLRHAIAPRLSRYKHPKHWIAISALPRNAQGKINRFELECLAHYCLQ
ncbi:2-succinylbenzoate-CoA ligase [Halomicronema hongdechloris C2206]|uniref:2-succinylbenzoate-CoA ligase n=1 Tax=Halomicronema hongdechloris C2206 TaxID=1641165 RepID=A0A1Z3HUP3_9CYAN|nr:AMP-binding protein [Halomicronema hongdechloris]ASC73995.1 2-succinylbenzoate-CoA ligase [Halomicronema hongdechloris C2206]